MIRGNVFVRKGGSLDAYSHPCASCRLAEDRKAPYATEKAFLWSRPRRLGLLWKRDPVPPDGSGLPEGGVSPRFAKRAQGWILLPLSRTLMHP